jgi:hypothetical protein
MPWLNFAQSQELVNAAYSLAEEIRGGKWSHLYDPHKPVAAEYYPEFIDELRRRCPGYTPDAYKRALADAMFATIW